MTLKACRIDALKVLTAQDPRGLSIGDIVQVSARSIGIAHSAGKTADTVMVELLAASPASVDKAIKRFSRFTGMKPAQGVRVQTESLDVGFVVGELDFVGYTTVREGRIEAYKHKFRKQSRPLLVSSSDGKSLHIVGGRYRFTERGIVDQ